MTEKLVVTQVASLVSRPHPQHAVMKGLGLHGIGTSVVVDNTPSFRGMIKKVIHLLRVEEKKS